MLQLFQNLKFSFKVVLVMAQRKFGSDGAYEVVEKTAYFNSFGMKTVYIHEEIEAQVNVCANEIDDQVIQYVEHGSGYYVKDVVSIEVKTFEPQPFRSAKVNGYIKTPFRKSGIVNFKNQDNLCFINCTLASLHWDEMKTKVSHCQLYRHLTWTRFYHLYDWTGVEGEVNIYNDLLLFEENNERAVNVFCHRGKKIYLVRESRRKYSKVVNLLLLTEKTDEGLRSHFVLIRDLGRFLRNGHGNRKFLCPHCLKIFNREREQIIHICMCVERARTLEEIFDVPEESFPDEDERLEVRNWHMAVPCPFVCLFDMETYSVPIPGHQRRKG